MFKPMALAAAVLTAFSLNAFAAKTELTVYTALAVSYTHLTLPTKRIV